MSDTITEMRTERFDWTGIYIDGNHEYSLVPYEYYGHLTWYQGPDVDKDHPGSGNKTEYGWDAYGNLIEKKDPMGNVTQMTYTNNQMESAQSPEGRRFEFHYNDHHEAEYTVADPGTGHLNITKGFEHDAYGNLIEEVGPYYASDGPTNAPLLAYEYDDLYHAYVTRSTDLGTGQGEVWTTAVYGPLGHKLMESEPVTSYSDALACRAWDYDKLGRPYYAWTSAYPESLCAITEYYGNDKVKKTTDPAGYETCCEYDGLGNLTQAKSQENAGDWMYTYYTYDDVGNLDTIKVARNDVSKATIATYGYDSLHRLTTVTTPGGLVSTATYDYEGKVATQKDARDNITSFTYDSSGREIRRDYTKSGHATPDRTVESEYDDDGLLLKVWDWVYPRVNPSDPPAREYSYDGAGRVTQEINRVAGTKTIYTYTAAGQKNSVEFRSYPADALLVTYTYGYYPNGRLEWALDSHTGVQTMFLYDARGRLITKALTNEASPLGWTYYDFDDSAAPSGHADSTNRPTDVMQYSDTGSLLFSGSYDYDKLGRITTEQTVCLPGSATTTYGYDRLGQLLSEARAGFQPYSYAYTYDPRGNRLTKAVPGGSTITYSYNSDNRLTSSTDGCSFGYDADGNMTSRTIGADTTGYVYDDLGFMTDVILPGGRDIQFVYDSSGQRIGRTETDPVRSTTYVYLDGSIIQELGTSGQVDVWYNPGISETRSAGTSYYVHDARGSSLGMYGADPAASAYDAWGNRIYPVSPPVSPFGYIGKEGYYTDADTGLMKLGARYYDPDIGRFITKDPARDGLNWYAYADSNPVNMSDPEGAGAKEIFAWPFVKIGQGIHWLGSTIWSGTKRALGISGGKNKDALGLRRASKANAELQKEFPEYGRRQQFVREDIGRVTKEVTDEAATIIISTAITAAVGEFANAKLTSRHFQKHGAEFGITTESGYLGAAKSFMLQTKNNPNLVWFTRTAKATKGAVGDLVQFDKGTGEFGAMSREGVLRTYFKPNDGYNYYLRQYNAR